VGPEIQYQPARRHDGRCRRWWLLNLIIIKEDGLVFWFGEEPGYEAVQSRDDEGEQEDDDGGSDEGREKEESVPQDEWRRTRF